MKQRCTLNAPAKLNLHLQVGEIRKDGFHDIQSLFIMVNLFDEITLSSLKTGNRCEINGGFNCSVEENLIYKAWKVFCESTGKKAGIRFDVKKNIPSFGGMGGGSSDAASAIKGLNLLLGTRMSGSELCSLGLRVGSDVPFFLSTAAAVVGGRGEYIDKIEEPRVLHFIIVFPEIRIATGDAYRWLEKTNREKSGFIKNQLIKDVYQSDPIECSRFRNDFTEVLSERYPVFTDIIDDLKNAGAVYSNVTGSGSVVFGLFASEKMAEKGFLTMKNQHKFVQKIKSLDRIPNAILE